MDSTTLVFVAADIDRGRRFTKRVARAGARRRVRRAGGRHGAAARDVRRGGDRADRAASWRERGRSDRAARRCSCWSSAPAATSPSCAATSSGCCCTRKGRSASRATDVDEVVAARGRPSTDDWAVVNAIARRRRGAGAARDRRCGSTAATRRTRWSGNCAGGCRRGWPRLTPSRVQPAARGAAAHGPRAQELRRRRARAVERLVVELTGKPLPRPPLGAGAADRATSRRCRRLASRDL